MYEIAIVGAGIIGTAIARELARYQLRIILVDKESDVANGTTKANSAIIHAGYDPEPGTLKSKLNALGNPMFDRLCLELGVPFRRLGSLVVANTEEEKTILDRLFMQGTKNGILHLQLLSQEKVREMEPRLQDSIMAALYAPTAGIVDPYMLTIALAENAVENGVEINLNSRVESIENCGTHYAIRLEKGRRVNARHVINAAGLHADILHNMVSKPAFRINPNRGQYFLLDQGTGNHVNHIIFPCPDEHGKGVLVLPTVHGNLLVGPNSERVENREDLQTTENALSYIKEQANKTVKDVPFDKLITAFSGLRAQTDGRDFIIEESGEARGFINVAGIDSPGLAAAPAIAIYVRDLLSDMMGPLREKKSFNPARKNPYVPFFSLPKTEKEKLLQADSRYGRVICRCENITEGEIVRAVHSTIGARTVDGVKIRVRAGMGRCQSGFCIPRVMEIIAREAKIKQIDVTKKGGNSLIVTSQTKGKIFSGQEKASLPERAPKGRQTYDGIHRFDLVVIGGGPAGMAAALGARKEGIKKILIIERDRELGGILQQCIHNGFGLHIFNEELTGPEYAERFMDQVEAAGIDYKIDTTVLDISDNKRLTAINPQEGLLQIQAGAIILAMGCRERTRGAVSIPGTRPAGIYTAGTAQRLVNLEGYMVGREVVIFGSGDIGLIMARRITLEGARVVAVVERKPYSEGLTRNIVQCLEDYNIPLLLRHTITEVKGKDRVTGVTLSQVDHKKKPIKSTEQNLPCDTLLLSRGLIPENELSRKAGIILCPVTGGPLVNDSMETSIAGIFACGNVVHVHDVVDWVTKESTKAGENAARYLHKKMNTDEPYILVKPGNGVRYIVPHKIRPANTPKNLELYLRVDGIYKNALIKVQIDDKTIKEVKRKNLTPGEMVVLQLEVGSLFSEQTKELRVDIN